MESFSDTSYLPSVDPLWFRDPADDKMFSIQCQCFTATHIYSPLLLGKDYSTPVTFDLPRDIFYDFWTLERVKGNGKDVTRDEVDRLDIPLHVSGGTFIPLRSQSANTTAEL